MQTFKTIGFYQSENSDALDLEYIDTLSAQVLTRKNGTENIRTSKPLLYTRNEIVDDLMSILYAHYSDNIDALLPSTSIRKFIEAYIEKRCTKSEVYHYEKLYPKWHDLFPKLKKQCFIIEDEMWNIFQFTNKLRNEEFLKSNTDVLVIDCISEFDEILMAQFVYRWHRQNNEISILGKKGFINQHQDWFDAYIEIQNSNHFMYRHIMSTTTRMDNLCAYQCCPYELAFRLYSNGVKATAFDTNVLKDAINMHILINQNLTSIPIEFMRICYPEYMPTLHMLSRKHIEMVFKKYADNMDNTQASLSIRQEFINILDLQKYDALSEIFGENKLDVFSHIHRMAYVSELEAIVL